MLKIENLTKAFKGLVAIDNINLEVKKGEVFAIIGPNGAGKTTLFDCISGIIKPTKGRVWFKDRDITAASCDRIASFGLARTFQNTRIFQNLKSLDNVKIGMHIRTKEGLISSILKTKMQRKEEEEVTQNALYFLSFVGLLDEAHTLAKNLPYGKQRLLEIARALALSPDLLLLDEPACGMNPQETNNLAGLIGKIKDMGITILLIEHDMRVVMNISDRVLVLDYGIEIACGMPSDVAKDPKVIEVYLGGNERLY